MAIVVRRVAVTVGEVVARHGAAGKFRQIRQPGVEHRDKHVARTLGDVPGERGLDGSGGLDGILVMPLIDEVRIRRNRCRAVTDPIGFGVFNQGMVLQAADAFGDRQVRGQTQVEEVARIDQLMSPPGIGRVLLAKATSQRGLAELRTARQAELREHRGELIGWRGVGQECANRWLETDEDVIAGAVQVGSRGSLPGKAD